MKSQILGAAGAGLASLVFAATVVAAGPTPSPSATTTQARDTVPSVLDLTQAQVQALRHDGLSLAQIAERQKVDPQRLVDALAAQWTSRIEVRVANGALTTDEATTLKADVQTRAKSMVNQVTLGGMQGAAVGAGPRNGAAGGSGVGNGPGPRGTGTGTGTCDGTGPHGAGRP
jgi:lambda repressor-like predicted transcriptional regulator